MAPVHAVPPSHAAPAAPLMHVYFVAASQRDSPTAYVVLLKLHVVGAAAAQTAPLHVYVAGQFTHEPQFSHPPWSEHVRFW
ncbi:MAG: hypothetical protein M0000_02140 [Actinomycetota bacterium]|nr:hypothetical protein [Actinomycetota bacterium]